MTPQYDTDGQLLLSPSQQKALNKQKEWEGFIKVLRQTTQLNEHFEQLASKTELMEDGGHSEGPLLLSVSIRTACHLLLRSLRHEILKRVSPLLSSAHSDGKGAGELAERL